MGRHVRHDRRLSLQLRDADRALQLLPNDGSLIATVRALAWHTLQTPNLAQNAHAFAHVLLRTPPDCAPLTRCWSDRRSDGFELHPLGLVRCEALNQLQSGSKLQRSWARCPVVRLRRRPAAPQPMRHQRSRARRVGYSYSCFDSRLSYATSIKAEFTACPRHVLYSSIYKRLRRPNVPMLVCDACLVVDR